MADPTTDITTAQALDAAGSLVDRFAPSAPDAIKTVAVNRLARWLQSFPADGSTNAVFGDQTLSSAKPGMDALKGSGAGAMLAPWRLVRARAVTADD